MKYYVRTTEERSLNNFSNINYIKLVDSEKNPVKSMIEQLKEISNDNSVFMEDDIILCEDFINKIENIINHFPNDIINFYFQPLKYQITGKQLGKNFVFNQCVYYPKGVAKQIAEEMENILKTNFKFEQYDKLQAKAMSNLGINFISYKPMLVQHIGNKSLLGNKWINNARTIYFIDDLNKLKLDYDDCKAMLKYTYQQFDKLGISYIKPKIVKKV